MQSTLTSKRMPFVIRETYTVELEYNEEHAIIHLPSVSKFNKTVYKDMKSVVDDVKSFLLSAGYQEVWAVAKPEDILMQKLVRRFGYEYRATAEGYDVFSVRT